MFEIIEKNEDTIIMMSDEAHFHLNGSVNKQNFQYWAPQNPHEVHESPLHSPKMTVWYAVGNVFVIGPYFYEENGITTTVNSTRYIDMISNFLEPELQNRRINNQNVWFQQDGATTHTARAAMAVVRAMFPDRLISRCGGVPWPPWSPDISMCDFFLWGYRRSHVYKGKPRTEELKGTICKQIGMINQELLERVEANFWD